MPKSVSFLIESCQWRDFLFSKAFDIFIFMTYNMWVLGILVLGFKRPSKRVRDDVKSPPTIGWSVVNILNKPAIRFDSV